MSQEGEFFHIPVLLDGVLEYLTFPTDRPARLIDGTLGGAGHTSALLEKYPLLEVLGIDRDDAALEASGKRLAKYGSRVKLARGNYSECADIAAQHNWDKVDGILFDIGVSSPQLDIAERGFSWRKPGPLDMRMDRRSELTAGRLLNRASVEELIHIFRNYGEIKQARRLAEAVVEARKTTMFGTTEELVALCDKVLGRSRPGTLPAPTLVFQALRIAVNDELGELERGLSSALELLKPGGRVAVISFHSLEDRMVKNFFRDESTSCICPPTLPVCCCQHKARVKVILKHPYVANEEELAANSRSACAKLRAAEKI
jgi:16S rRNA (cytosine1402-N4)-methyltransferase